MDRERDVLQVLARFVRAMDSRSSTAIGALFSPEARVEIYHGQSWTAKFIAELQGPDAIGRGLVDMMRQRPPHGWSHHATQDSIVHVNGTLATIDAQFIVFETLGSEVPDAGWPAGTTGAQGTVQLVEAGHYQATLREIDRQWRISLLKVIHDLPVAITKPAATLDVIAAYRAHRSYKWQEQA